MVYGFKYDDDDSSLINKQKLASSDTSKTGSDTITANELQVKDRDNMMWIMNGSQKEAAKAKSTTTITESSSSGGYLEMAKNVAVVGGAALAAGWGLYCLLSSTSSATLSSSSSSEKDDEKLMKAPGEEGETISRKEFEDNPRKYFQDHRKRMKFPEKDGGKSRP